MMSTLMQSSSVDLESPAGGSSKADGLRLASVLALVATYLCVRVLFLSPTTRPMRAEALNPFLFAFSGGIDTSRQRMGYLEAVILIAAVVLLAPLLSKLLRLPLMQKVQPWLARITYIVVASFFVGTFWWSWKDPISLILGLIAVPLLYIYRRGLTSTRSTREFRLIACLLPILAILPGLFAPLDLSVSPARELVAVQAHYTLVVGQGDRLAAGQRLFQEVIPGYSTILTVVFGGWQKHVGSIDFGGYVTIIRVLQAAFLLAALFLYKKYAHGWKLATLAAVALIVPWYHFNQLGFLWPNNTPWRALGLPLGLLALHLIRRRPLPVAAYLIGITAGTCILLNIETGISITVGLLAFAWFRYKARNLKEYGALLKAAGLIALGIATAVSLFLIGSRLWLGYWPDVSYLPVMWQAAAFVASTGYSAMKGEFYPMAVVIFAHAAYALIGTAIIARDRLGFKPAFRAAVAATLIVWFAYYINRPHPWNLVTFYFLYGFLLIDVIQTVLVNFRRGKPAAPNVLAAAATLAVVLVPQLISAYRTNCPRYTHGLEVARHGSAGKPSKLVSGVFLPADIANELEEKAAFIKEASKVGPPIYFTASSFLIPKLSGVQPPVPFGDTFTEVITKTDYVRLVSLVVQRSPDYLYFDSPTNLLKREGWTEYYNQLRSNLSTLYEKEIEAHGWEVWKCRSPGGLQGSVGDAQRTPAPTDSAVKN